MTPAHTLVQLLAQAAVPSEGALPGATTGYGVQLVRSVVALAVVCALALGSLRWAAKRGYGVGRAMGRAGGVRVIDRVALDARRSVYVVTVGSRGFLLGSGEQALTLLAELSPADLEAVAPTVPSATPGVRFTDVLARFRGSAGGPGGSRG